MNKPVIIVSTYPNKKSLNIIGNEIIKNRLAACVNITQISSIYRWEGKIQNSAEYLALFKTTKKNKVKLVQKLKQTHPYEVPEIAEIEINSINKPYLKWMVNSIL